MGASYSGLYEEGEVEHINVPPLPIPLVTKTESYFTVKGNDPRWGKCCIQTMLTRKKTKVSRATGAFKAKPLQERALLVALKKVLMTVFDDIRK